MLASGFTIWTRENGHLPTVPQPRAVPQPTIVLKAVVIIGLPTAPVGVIVSMLSVVRVDVTGSVTVAVIVTVSLGPPFPPGTRLVVVIPPGSRLVVVVLSTPDVMMPVPLLPGG